MAENTDIQVGRFSILRDLAFANWIGLPVELGGRGGVVQIWGVHYYSPHLPNPGIWVVNSWMSALSSNPDHEGEQALGLDDFMGSPALYGTMADVHSGTYQSSGGAAITHYTQVIPLYGIIRPRRQIWVNYFVGRIGSERYGVEIYYSEIDATARQEAQVNYKYGKYRRGR